MIDVPIVYVSRFSLFWTVVYIGLATFLCSGTVLFAIAAYGAREQIFADNTTLFGEITTFGAFVFCSVTSIRVATKGVRWQLPRSFTLLISDTYISLTAKQVTCRIPIQSILTVSKVRGRGLYIENWYGKRVFVSAPAMLVTMRPGIEPAQYVFPLYSMPDPAEVIIDAIRRRLLPGGSLSVPG